MSVAPPSTPVGPASQRPLHRMDTLGRLAEAASGFVDTVDLLYVKPPDSNEDVVENGPPSTDGAAAAPATVAPAGASAASAAPAAAAAAGSAAAAAAKPAHKEPAWVEGLNAFVSKNKLTPAQAHTLAKAKFTAGLANVMLSSLLFSHPQAFIVYYQLKVAVLLLGRWVVYRLKGWHWYLVEFCYVAIALGCVHLAFFPHSAALHKLTIALYAGILTGAVVATRNAFVLHSCDKITSLFQHLSPALVAYLLRWQPERAVRGWDTLSPEVQQSFNKAGFVELTLWPMGVWLAWATTYYIWVFVIAEKTVRERGYATMFSLQTRNPKSGLSKFIFSFKTRPLQYAAYMAFHGGCSLVGVLLNNLWFHSQLAHTVLVLGVLGGSLWSGAAFYIKRVMLGEEKLAAERAAAKAAKAS